MEKKDNIKNWDGKPTTGRNRGFFFGYIQSYIPLLFLLLSAAGTVTAQGESIFKAADRKYDQLHFGDGVVLYKAVLEKHPGNVHAMKRLADCYYQMNAYADALKIYEELISATGEDILEDRDVLQYAEVLANNGKYNTSKIWYEKYLLRQATDSRGKVFSKAYPKVSKIALNRSGWDLEFLSINTDRAEFSPSFYKEGLLFVSNREHGVSNKRVFGWNNTPFTDMYYVDTTTIKTIDLDSLKNHPGYQNTIKKTIVNNDDTMRTSNDSNTLDYDTGYLADTLGIHLASMTRVERLRGSINSKYHDGPVMPFNDSTLLFTRNNYVKGKYGKSEDGTNKLKLYLSQLSDKEKWGSIEEVPFNSDEYSVGHPSLAPDGKTLFFASDMPGGKGGSDIYSVALNVDGSWGVPKNMGDLVNTEGDELFPYIDNGNNLIFSSTGLPGFGGLDLFSTPLTETMSAQTPAENLGPPINSSGDDFGLILNNDGVSGYFSSNRRGNDDIYGIFKDKIDLVATILYRSDNATVNEAEVVLLGGGEEFGKVTEENGTAHFLLERERDYTLMAIKSGYNKVKGTFTTKGIKGGETMEMTLYLDTCLKEYMVRAVYFDLDRYNIRPDGEEVLNEVTALLEDNPELDIQISSHTDQRASKAYNIRLSKNRAKATKAYLESKGVDSTRIKLAYYGESILTNHCADGVDCNELEQQMNRRSEIQIVHDGVNLSNICNKNYDPEKTESAYFLIQGIVLDEATELPVPNTLVRLNNKGGDTIRTNEEGQFKFPLSPNTDYEFIFSRENYVTQRFYITTKGLLRDHIFDYTIKLKEIVLDERFTKKLEEGVEVNK